MPPQGPWRLLAERVETVAPLWRVRAPVMPMTLAAAVVSWVTAWNVTAPVVCSVPPQGASVQASEHSREQGAARLAEPAEALGPAVVGLLGALLALGVLAVASGAVAALEA